MTESAGDLIAEASISLDKLEATHAKHAQTLAQIERNARLSDDAKRQDADAARAQFEQLHADTKANTFALLDRATAVLDDEHEDLLDAVKVRPRDATTWQEASARDRFVREDILGLIEGAQSAQIATAFRRAMRRGDTAQAYLIARHGERELGTHAKSAVNHTGTERERAALDALRAAIAEHEKPDAAKLKSITDRRTRARELRNRLSMLKSAREMDALKARFHI